MITLHIDNIFLFPTYIVMYALQLNQPHEWLQACIARCGLYVLIKI